MPEVFKITRDHTCFFHKAKIINKDFMMTLFKTVLKVLEEMGLFERVGVSSQTRRPLYLNEFLAMSRFYLGRTK